MSSEKDKAHVSNPVRLAAEMDQDDNEPKMRSTAAIVIAGIVIGCCVGYIVIFIVGVVMFNLRKQKSNTLPIPSPSSKDEGPTGYYNPSFEMA